jgi:phytoene dehydrogenase-like protein
MSAYDAVVVGSGPNGLAAAITLARAGRSVLVLERAEGPGGGLRSRSLTLPGFLHDVCSAVHPLAVSSPFFSGLPLADHGVEWIEPPIPAAHPVDDHRTAALHRTLADTARALGLDGSAYEHLMRPFVAKWPALVEDALAPVRVPRHPLLSARFGLLGLRPAASLAGRRFQTPAARALFAGIAAHAILPLERPLTSAFGLILGAAGHAVGWPIPRGGSQTLADALVAHLRSLGARWPAAWTSSRSTRCRPRMSCCWT